MTLVGSVGNALAAREAGASARVFPVLKTLGGCGGTIVARALAACGALILSEVNPRACQLFGAALNPLFQMRRDHFEKLPGKWRCAYDSTLGDPNIFGQFMSDVLGGLDRPLVIRDYSYIDYIGVPFIWPMPSEPSLEAALLPFGRIDAAVLVRHPARSYLSLLRHGPLSTVLTPDFFVRGHLAFMHYNLQYPLFRYEAFLTEASEMQRLCEVLHVEYSPNWSARIGDAPALTGNADAVVAREIKIPEDTSIESVESLLRKAPGYADLLELTGYS